MWNYNGASGFGSTMGGVSKLGIFFRIDKSNNRGDEIGNWSNPNFVLSHNLT